MDFFKKLRGKLEREPDRNFDQRFWAKFDREFAPQENLTWFGKAMLGMNWLRWAPVATLVIVAFVGFQMMRQGSRLSGVEQEFAQITPEDAELLSEFGNELDWIEEVPDDLLSATDEEWSAVLNGETS